MTRSISKNSKLPKIKRLVLIIDEDGFIDLGWWFGSYWMSRVLYTPTNSITHWQPLPELPKQQGEN